MMYFIVCILFLRDGFVAGNSRCSWKTPYAFTLSYFACAADVDKVSCLLWSPSRPSRSVTAIGMRSI